VGVAVKLIVRVAGIVLSVILAATVFSSGVASADPYAGKTYSEVAAKIAERNGKAIVATVTGSQLGTDSCIVSSWSKGKFLDSSGNLQRGEFLLNLNCNRLVASPGHPGNSVTTPEGSREKSDETFAARVTANPAICDRSDAYAAKCARVCTKQGLCEYDA
jgi:hypothetical protein